MTKEFESPEDYYFWSSLAVLSAVVQKKVWWNKFAYKLYPNIYVFLIGDSGIRKGPPIGFAKNCIEKLGKTRYVFGRYSIQGLIKELRTARTRENGAVWKDAQAFIASGEFAASLIKDEYSVHILTDLYNTNEHEETWTNTLKTEEQEVLKQPCLTLLGASNEINLTEFLTEQVKGGGFLARTFCVHATETRGTNSLMFQPNDNIDYAKLLPHLESLYELEGEVKPTKGARQFYDDWYNEFRSRKTEDKTGTFNRIHEQILKVAMLLSLSDREDLVVTQEHVEDALAYCEKTLPAVKRITMGGKSEISDPTVKILKKLVESEGHEIRRDRLLQWGWGDFDALVLDRIISNLDQMEVLKIRRDGRFLFYKLTERAASAYMEAKKEIN